ncbi:hypothetical protein ACQR1I_22230 [Bradyrhizobium sp. HKCCYLS2038]|uniref:hypothetical protein n=1 Tax=unclassified Bradyrhizobium TaxID=2631580 RepID=UPI003EB701C4
MINRTGNETMSDANSGAGADGRNNLQRVKIECSLDNPFDPSIHHSQPAVSLRTDIGLYADDRHLYDDGRIDLLRDMVKEHASLCARHRTGLCPVE